MPEQPQKEAENPLRPLTPFYNNNNKKKPDSHKKYETTTDRQPTRLEVQLYVSNFLAKTIMAEYSCLCRFFAEACNGVVNKHYFFGKGENNGSVKKLIRRRMKKGREHWFRDYSIEYPKFRQRSKSYSIDYLTPYSCMVVYENEIC